MANSQKVKVSVVILSWNTKDLLEQCLKSIPFSMEIIVVDNGSIDNTLQFLDSLKWPNLKVIKNKSNLGFAKGNNQGLEVAKGDFAIILNSDTIVQKGALEKLADYLIKFPQVGAVSPLLVNKDGSFQEEYYMRFPNLWQIFGYHCPLSRPLFMKTPLRWLVVSRLKDKPFEVEQLPGAAMMARHGVWNKVGLLDEDYQFLYEDVDWCYRAKKMGLKLVIVPEAKITHLGGASWKQKLNFQSFEFYRQFFSSLLFFVKNNYGEKKLKKFRMALIINFFFQFKFKLAKVFLNQGNQIKQEKLWP